MPDTSQAQSQDDGLHVRGWERYRPEDVVETTQGYKGIVTFVDGPIVVVRLINPETGEVLTGREFYAGDLVLVNREPAAVESALTTDAGLWRMMVSLTAQGPHIPTDGVDITACRSKYCHDVFVCFSGHVIKQLPLHDRKLCFGLNDKLLRVCLVRQKQSDEQFNCCQASGKLHVQIIERVRHWLSSFRGIDPATRARGGQRDAAS